MVEISWEKLGANIRAERERQGMSVEELAERVREPIDYVVKAESGKKRVTLVMALSFCQALGVTTDQLLGGIEK